MVVPLVIGALDGGIRQIIVDIGKFFENKVLLKRTVCEMQKTVLMDSETTLRKVLSGLVQEMDLQIILFMIPSIIHTLLVFSLTTIRF